MRNRMAILAGAVTVGLLITGIAFAAQDVDESAVNVSLAESQTLTLPADKAGVIVLSRANGQLQIVSATPNTGYAAEVEVAIGREVEADFRGNGLRVQFNAELEDGIVRVRIRTEADDNNGSTSSTGLTSSTGSTSVTGSTSPTSTSPTAPTSTTPAVNGAGNLVLADGQVSQVVVADAGSVLLRRNGGSLTIVSTESNPGWVVEVEVAIGREVEGDFRNGSRRVKFNFELEDGVVRVRIESEGSSSGDSSTTSTTSGSGSSTSTTNTTGASSLPTGSVTYNLDSAGTVTVIFANGGMTIGSINPAAGWTIADSEQKSDEIEVELTNGDAEAELKLKINNGVLEVEIDRKNS
jgi:frataxin-like iron-binding protein CyaY